MDVLHKGSQSRITIPTEPAFLALGPNHLAVGMNNKVWLTIIMQVYLSCAMSLQKVLHLLTNATLVSMISITQSA